MKLGVIGGSGLGKMACFQNAARRHVETAWGEASDELLFGHLGDVEIVFLPRHGRSHRLTPSEINYRANIAALKQSGCHAILSLSAVGSFREDLPPGGFALVEQYLDRTQGRVRSYFGDGIVGHVSLADPTCRAMGDVVVAAAERIGLPLPRDATYVAIDGPQFSSRAESLFYRAQGCDVIGMTNMPEARLAREAELCYAAVAMVTDYDSWRTGEAAVDMADVVRVMHANAAQAAALVTAVAAQIGAHPHPCPVGCSHALDHAIVTEPPSWPVESAARLRSIAGRVMG